MGNRDANVEEPKYQRITRWILDAVSGGKYVAGQRLPSEFEFMERFHVSRPTVARALLELRQMGIVERRQGSGTYIAKAQTDQRYVFGLLVPELGESEVFGPICQGIAQCLHDIPYSKPYELLWAQTQRQLSEEERTLNLCEQYISRKVSGVFFVPLALAERTREVNQRITASFDKAQIPVVLIDRDVVAYPQRGHYDLVGVDNPRAGYTITEHLLKLGCRRIVFLARRSTAPTIQARARGFREALSSYGMAPGPEWIRQGDCKDADLVCKILAELKPEAFVCANDITAAHLMQTLSGLGVRIPAEVRIVGFDDVKYATLLQVPLTTMHQPCQDIGATALVTMFSRIAQPNLPPRHIMLDCGLVVRESCGSAGTRQSEPVPSNGPTILVA